MGKINMPRVSRLFLVLAFIMGAFLPVADPQTVLAQEEEYGYEWRADRDFESSFEGVLSIEYGVWKDGKVAEVLETSATKIGCTPVGGVHLNGGDAVFTGGYLQCRMNLAETVLNNHGLEIEAVEEYGGLILRTKAYGEANVDAPLFVHPNAIYHIDYSSTSQVTPRQLLSNGGGGSLASFPGVTINTWQAYTFDYSCATPAGPCGTTFNAGPQSQFVPSPSGFVQFSTEPTVFTIGGDGGTVFTGRIAASGIDPGNTSY